MDFKSDIYIDRYNLIEELIRQPQKYYDWALAWERAGSEKEFLKSKLDLVKADIEARIRKNPERYDIPEGKATESAIKAEVMKHNKVKKTNRKYLKALSHEKKMAEAKAAFRQRKSMLEKIVDLNLQLHFAEPKLPTTEKEAIYQHRRKGITRRLRDNLNGNSNK